MPSRTVDGFQIRIVPGDHAPAHVHVCKAGAEVIFIIEGGVIALRDVSRGMTSAEVKAAQAAVASIIEDLLEMWEEAQPK